MSCGNCGHDARHGEGIKCPTYTVRTGWCTCLDYEYAPSIATNVHDGKAVLRKLYDDTKAFRDKSVKDHEAKNRTRPSLGMSERMKLGR